MRIAGIMQNDMSDGIDGTSVSLWTQGCPHECPGCHNPSTWDFNGGKEIPIETIVQNLIGMIDKDGVERNLSILGGEPLCDENIYFVLEVIARVRNKFPNIKIIIWTGYTLEELTRRINKDHELFLLDILQKTNYLIDGRFIKEKHDVSLILRGSSNQRIFEIKNKRFKKMPVFKDVTEEFDKSVYSDKCI